MKKRSEATQALRAGCSKAAPQTNKQTNTQTHRHPHSHTRSSDNDSRHSCSPVHIRTLLFDLLSVILRGPHNG